MKRLICLMLALVMLTALMISCNNQTDTPEDTTTASSSNVPLDTTTAAETTTAVLDIVFGRNGEKSDYVVIRPEKCGQKLIETAAELFRAINAVTGVSGSIKDDWYRNESEIAPHEILIGATNRPESSKYTDTLKANDWIITVENEKIIINGGSETATINAVRYFMENYVAGKTDTLSLPGNTDYHYVSKLDTINVLDVKDKLKIIGRYSEVKDGITCDWTASGIEFTADCEGEVIVGLTSAKSASGSGYDGDSYFTVYVDGIRQQERLEAKVGECQLTIASGLTKGVHTFRLLKQSHVAHSNTVISTISLNGTIGDRPADNKIYLEFYGDSITCGYGLASESVKTIAGLANNDAYYCDGTQTYAFLTAEALGADYSMVSVSGWRLAGTSASIPNTCYPFINWNRSGLRYDFTARVPDAVVINLGTNDYSGSVGDQVFAQDMETWIKRIRKDYGNDSLPVVFVVNSMNDGYQNVIKVKLEEMGGESAGLYMLKTVLNRGGLSNHPTCAGQKKTGELLTKLLQEKVLAN
ncbi:MAG: GDSL-type esterase/lipase family protein [Eubacteriales bacterium]|nr:GDSL-type esterase/lipase family protein [Eubacteriales bacterium]